MYKYIVGATRMDAWTHTRTHAHASKQRICAARCVRLAACYSLKCGRCSQFGKNRVAEFVCFFFLELALLELASAPPRSPPRPKHKSPNPNYSTGPSLSLSLSLSLALIHYSPPSPVRHSRKGWSVTHPLTHRHPLPAAIPSAPSRMPKFSFFDLVLGKRCR